MMEFFTNLSPAALLATGGIAAVVATCWRQVKTISTYLSSFVVVRASVDSSMRHPLNTYFKTQWKAVPSGLIVYRGKYMQFRDRAHYTTVPFRMFGNSMIFYRKWQIILFNVTYENCTMIGLRGMIDFDAIIKAALQMDEGRHAKQVRLERSSRFQVINVIGREKGIYSDSLKSQDNAVGINPTEAPSTLSCFEPDPAIDPSFMYHKDEYLYDKTVDPFSALYFPESINKYVHQAQQWLDLGDWYTERSIPWRRGWLLHGPGGTGKSSLSKAVAQKLRIPVYHYYLATLSDQEFIREWQCMTMPCMVLFEDFDTVFNLRESKSEHLTFDCILNQISGVGTNSGIFLVVTTNHIDKIDPALGVEQGSDGVSTRPGRIDTVIHVGNMDRNNRKKMASQILRDWPELIDHITDCKEAQEVTPVQFQEMCIQVAYKQMSTVKSPVRAVA